MVKYLTAICCLLAVFTDAQKTDEKLEKKITELLKGFHGDVGVYVRDLKHNRIVEINADTVFPTASIVKIP
ncbi:MAG TPA: serine hydrolase, partial [Parafilimonas sp.]|nr:serine hydrolase [Parafilimonas sp.]